MINMLYLPKGLKEIITEAIVVRLGVDVEEPEMSLVQVEDHGYNRYSFAYKNVSLGLSVQMDTEDAKIITATLND